MKSAQAHPSHQRHDQSSHTGAYGKFFVNMAASLVVMYIVMFSMIDGKSDFRNNLNTLYMVLTMVAPMGWSMLFTMPSMYPNRRVNVAICLLLVLIFVAGLIGTRMQIAIGDRQFIASMIPRHSGAILMCREASLKDAELVALCERIAAGQRQEIDQMENIAARLSVERH